jgi:uncharacterized protein YfaS (alpha-2-macroglobulin family)
MLIRPLQTFLFFLSLIPLLLVCSPTHAQVGNYENKWSKMELLIKKGLPQSALKEVKSIYNLAKKEKQDAQVIKSLVYMVNLQEETREDNAINSIKEIEKEIKQAKGPSASILKSMLAGMYWNYFQANRWKLYNRTNTVNFKKEDIATWTSDDLHKKISELYLASLKEETLLKQTKLEPYDAIIVKGNTRPLRPTLYDLLAHTALTYFKNDEQDITRPAYAFEINDNAYYGPAESFLKLKIKTKDSLSLHVKALSIFQYLLAFHLHDSKPDALIDADIERLEFVNQYSVAENKTELYINALQHLAKKYTDYPAAAQAWYLQARYYDQQAASYKPYGDTTHRYDRIKAKEICEKVLLQKQESEGWVNCYNLLNNINRKDFNFNVEKVNIPGLPFRILVNYRNISKLYLRIIKADDSLKKELENQYKDSYWKKIVAAVSLRSWQQDLPATNDLQTHSVEIKAGALQPGEYLILASSDADFSGKQTLLGARLVYISNISFVNDNNNFFVLNRDNGQPLVNASVQVWGQRYDYKTSKYIKEKKELYETDANGFFRMMKQQKQNYGYNYLLDITWNQERFFINDLLYTYYYESADVNDQTQKTTTYLFTDRGLYRPGQTVYFKGIVTRNDPATGHPAIRTNFETTIYLRDANEEEIDSLKMTTNEFGSFAAKFQLPQNTLNGSFSLAMKDETGTAHFNVEEYKRPKFYVDYEKLKGSYKAGDSIHLTGFAKAYAGNNIDNGIVKYRVVRQPRFIYPWLFSRWWQPPVKEMEIAHGELQTGTDGKFVINFAAIPDKSIDKKFDPVFDYKVYADVTDINGETRSAETTVSVSYKSLLLKTSIPSSLLTDSLQSIFVRTENINGEFQSVNITVTITKLKEEKRLLRKRYWERPDEFVMSKEEYIRNFPNDEYDNEANFSSWEKENRVYENTDSSRLNGNWSFSSNKFQPGFYSIEIVTKDKDGNEVKDVKYFELYDSKNKKLNLPQYLWAESSKPVEPGETAKFQIGTSAENLFVVEQVNKKSNDQGKESNYNFIKLNNEKKSFDFRATEADRGGYSVNYMFVKNNRLYQYTEAIKVPWSNKDLQIEYATFRDKTLPGSEEKWKLKVSGYKGTKVAAEMLASMYDASLDQFYPFDWKAPYIWPYYYNYSIWNGSQNFSEAVSTQRFIGEGKTKSFRKDYDYLIANLQIRPRQLRMLKFEPPKIVEDKFTPPKIVKNEELSENKMVEKVDLNGVGYLSGKVSGITITSANKKMERDTVMETKKPLVSSNDQTFQIRKNFNETAFFFPDLRTDSSGAIEFSFTMPEALTKWKFQALAHTKDLALGYSSKEIITQKELMVQPNAPRFLREGDRMELSAKIVNLSDKELTGQAELQLFDAATNQPVDGWFQNMYAHQYFTVAPGQSEAVQFPIEVPYLFNKALTWRIVAKAGDFSDGEEASLPVLTNKMLVTESLPLSMRGYGTKHFSFEKLLHPRESETLQNYGLTVEYTSNPAWNAVQALPYLMEYPYECAEQTWNRYYANALAASIVNASPRIKQIFEQWKTKDTVALLSNLQKNEELKSVLLQETPWVLHAKNEEQQKKNIALLFDLTRMSKELGNNLDKLKQMQCENGGFVWFNGGPDDRYITQYIVTGIGHLKKLNAITKDQEEKINSVLETSISYLDNKIKEDYDYLVKQKVKLEQQHLSFIEIQYLYMRSFFPEHEIPKASQAAVAYYYKQAQQFWASQNKYMQGMIALATYRKGDIKTSSGILKSLKETAVNNEETGMYWKTQHDGWFWYEAPIETQSLLIEAFSEAGKDDKTTDDLRTWLLKNKQTNNWQTTKATADACYAFLLKGSNWLSNEPVVEIQLGKAVISNAVNHTEAGTGYFKKTIEGQFVSPDMGNISLTVRDSKVSPTGGDVEGASPSWGAVYWQYFEDLDKITTAATPLQLSKKLFVEKNSDHGPVLTPVKEGDAIRVGDKIKVRIELRVDRDMEYVHMKDMRASSLEPVNVLSEYKWQGGLGYYETTKDASTNFFFDHLNRGTYVFEYTLFANQKGNFSNGVTTIQCMYAPEFSAHSEGIRINVE